MVVELSTACARSLRAAVRVTLALSFVGFVVQGSVCKGRSRIVTVTVDDNRAKALRSLCFPLMEDLR